MKALLARLLAMLRREHRCSAKLRRYAGHHLSTAEKAAHTGCLRVSPINEPHAWVLMCSRVRKKCDGCPRLKAIRQLCAPHVVTEQSRSVPSTSPGHETNVDNGHGQVAYVDHLNEKSLCRAIGGESPTRLDHKADAIPRHRIPRVEQTQYSAQNRDGECRHVDPQLAHFDSPETPSESVALLDRFAVLCGMIFVGILVWEAAWLCIVAPYR